VVKRRELSKLLLAGAVSAARPVEGDGANKASPRDIHDPAERALASVRDALTRPGLVSIPNGTYRLHHGLQTLAQSTIIGESRQSTILAPGEFDGYALEVGDGRAAPNAGLIQRLRFFGARGNRGCLHLNSLCHMWRLDELVFSGGPCPAMVVDNCWDSNFTNIDILGHITPGTDPAATASVILRNGTANIYCRGLRIEGALSGALYVDAGPNYIVTGKIDDGAGGPQTAAAITVAAGGELLLDDFYIGGVLEQYQIDLVGTVRLGKVILEGGTRKAAAIHDRRSWQHYNAETVPGISAAGTGPAIGILDLGQAKFNRFHPSLEWETPTAVFSRIYPIRQVENLIVTASGAVRGDTTTVSTSLRPRHADTYKNSFLVHNATGTAADRSSNARRRSLRSFPNGDLVLHGAWEPIVDGDWSIEYTACHATPLRYRNAILSRGQRLFTIVSDRVTVDSEMLYASSPREPAYGTTVFQVRGPGLSRNQDVRGLFLIDNASGEPYYIQYGIDEQWRLGVIYDRRQALSGSRSFSIVAGYAADVEIRGDVAVWRLGSVEHRARITELIESGFDTPEFPLWGLH